LNNTLLLIYLILLFSFIVYFSYHTIKKQKWIIRKYFYYYFIFFFISLFLPFIFYSYPRYSFKAFPYGIIEYNNKNLLFCGTIAPFINNSKYLLKTNHLSATKITSAKKLIPFLYKYNYSKFVSINKKQCYLKNGIIQTKNTCYLFEKKLQPQNWKTKQLSQCNKIYFIHSKKSHPQNKNYKALFSLFNLNAKKVNIQYVNYNHWVE